MPRWRNSEQWLEARRKRLRVMEHILEGRTDPSAIAASLGMSKLKAMRCIDWCLDQLRLKDRKEIEEKRAVQAARLLDIFSKALTAFERSKKPTETVTTEYGKEKCKTCKGTGMVGKTEWCPACSGDGEVQVERVTKQVRGEPGDPSFLRVALDALEKYGKIYHLSPPPVKVSVNQDNRQVSLTSVNVQAIPEDAVIEARRAILKLKELAAPVAPTAEGTAGSGGNQSVG